MTEGYAICGWIDVGALLAGNMHDITRRPMAELDSCFGLDRVISRTSVEGDPNAIWRFVAER